MSDHSCLTEVHRGSHRRSRNRGLSLLSWLTFDSSKGRYVTLLSLLTTTITTSRQYFSSSWTNDLCKAKALVEKYELRTSWRIINTFFLWIYETTFFQIFFLDMKYLRLNSHERLNIFCSAVFEKHANVSFEGEISATLVRRH